MKAELHGPLVLRTPRLLLRKPRSEDADDIIPLINDTSVTRYTLNIPYPYGPSDLFDYLKRCREWEEAGTSLNLFMVLKDEKRAIGGIALMEIQSEHGKADVGYWIGRTYRRKGYTQEALGILCKHAFNELGLDRLQAVIFASNTASKRVLEGSGFTLEGKMRQRYVKDGKKHDGLIYSLLSSDRDQRTINDD